MAANILRSVNFCLLVSYRVFSLYHCRPCTLYEAITFPVSPCCYNIVMQRSLVVYHEISHLSFVFFGIHTRLLVPSFGLAGSRKRK